MSNKEVIKIIINQQEQDAMDKLTKRGNDTALSLKQIENSRINIKEQSKICQQEIEAKFKTLSIQIDNKKKEVLEKLKLIEQEQLNKVSEDSKTLENEQNNIKSSIKTCNELLSTDTNSSERQQKIITMVSNIINKPAKQVESSVKYTVLFNDDGVTSFIKTLCDIGYGQHPLPLIRNIRIESITANGATVKWQSVLLKKNENIKTTSELFIRLECMNDDIDEKEKESNINSKLIKFDRNQKEYLHQFDKLNKNTKYDLNINIFEQSTSTNTKTKRNDFKSVAVSFTTFNIVPGKDGTLLIRSNETKTLNSDYQYIFTSVVIESGAVLTVTAWNKNEKKGGRLLIKSMSHFTIKKGGKIELDGKGYSGGSSRCTGESYDKPSIGQGQPNLGGGGGGAYSCYAGGGGYGSPGETNQFFSRQYDNGGQVYGDKELSVLHLGSGGGGDSDKGGGGNGGGAIKIECDTLENNGQISVNGGDANSVYDGGGSGGSIFIICKDFIMDKNDTYNCFINACGGKNDNETTDRGGHGGDGRIRIKLSNNKHTATVCISSGQIKPNPYVGDILNALTKQPSVLNEINDLEVEQKTNLVTTKYVFKSIDSENNKITCLDGEYNEITFDLDASNKDLLEKINKVIEDGKNQKKDVTIIVTTLDKNDKLTHTVSDAKIE